MDKRMHMRSHETPTRTLWHYTSPEGLIGMVQGQGFIWATHYEHMNDRNEVHIGHDPVLDELVHILASRFAAASTTGRGFVRASASSFGTASRT